MKFIHKPCPNIPSLEQINKDGNRHYERDSKKYYSVTKVLGIIGREGIQRWKDYLIRKHGVKKGKDEAERISQNSMKVGTALHLIIENYLNNKGELPIKGDFEFQPMDIFNNLKPILNKINNITAQEVRLYSDRLGLAGTADCIAEFDGVPSIIDFKNARKKKYKSYITKHFIQATCYSLMWKELTGQDIEQLVIIVGGWDGSTDVFIENRSNFIEKMWEVLIQHEKELNNL